MTSTRKSPDLTPEQESNVRMAMRFLHQQCGSWYPLGKALKYDASALARIASGHRSVTANLVFRVAKLAKVGLDDVLTGKYPPVGTCPNCGYCRNLPPELRIEAVTIRHET